MHQCVSVITPCSATNALQHTTPSSTPTPRLSFQCGECLRQFSRRYSLQEHLATHTGEKAYRCLADGCSKCFTTASNLARHRRLHGDEFQLLTCPVLSCMRRFTTSRNLQRHMRVHVRKPTRRCKFAHCSKTFSSTSNLNRHMRNQHIRYGHPLANEVEKDNQSPTRTKDIEPANLSLWKDDSSYITSAISTTSDLNASLNYYISDEELLEVLSWLLDDDNNLMVIEELS